MVKPARPAMKLRAQATAFAFAGALLLAGALASGCSRADDDAETTEARASVASCDDAERGEADGGTPRCVLEARCARQTSLDRCLDQEGCAWGITRESHGTHTCFLLGHVVPEPGSGDPGTSHELPDEEAPLDEVPGKEIPWLEPDPPWDPWGSWG